MYSEKVKPKSKTKKNICRGYLVKSSDSKRQDAEREILSFAQLQQLQNEGFNRVQVGQDSNCSFETNSKQNKKAERENFGP